MDSWKYADLKKKKECVFSCKSIKKERMTHIHCQSKETKEPQRNKGREEQCKKKKERKKKAHEPS